MLFCVSPLFPFGEFELPHSIAAWESLTSYVVTGFQEEGTQHVEAKPVDLTSQSRVSIASYLPGVSKTSHRETQKMGEQTLSPGGGRSKNCGHNSIHSRDKSLPRLYWKDPGQMGGASPSATNLRIAISLTKAQPKDGLSCKGQIC